MINSRAIAVIGLIFGLISIFPTAAQDLIVYQFDRSSNYEGNRFDERTIISFYADGLIHTYRQYAYDRSTRKETLYKSFTVEREGQVIRQTFEKNDRPVTKVSFSIHKDYVSIESADVGPGHTFELRKDSKDGSGQEVWQHVYDGNEILTFRFSSNVNCISQTAPVEGQTCYHSVTKLPVINTTGTGMPSIGTGEMTSGKFWATVQYFPDPVFAAYRIDGTLRHSDVLTTVLNFEMLAGYEEQLVLFPYIGGLPDPQGSAASSCPS